MGNLLGSRTKSWSSYGGVKDLWNNGRRERIAFSLPTAYNELSTLVGENLRGSDLPGPQTWRFRSRTDKVNFKRGGQEANASGTKKKEKDKRKHEIAQGTLGFERGLSTSSTRMHGHQSGCVNPRAEVRRQENERGGLKQRHVDATEGFSAQTLSYGSVHLFVVQVCRENKDDRSG